jgi:hypothetical protein
MGCPCREVRNQIARLPGGKFLLGLLPDLPADKGPHMKMVAPVPGQSIQTSSGNHYRADEARVIHDVNPDDVSELRRVGCVDLAEAIAQRDEELPAEKTVLPVAHRPDEDDDVTAAAETAAPPTTEPHE